LRKATIRKRYRVVVHGLSYFCRKLPALLSDEGWDVRDYSQHRLTEFPALAKDLARCDLIYLWGGRITMGKFLWGARCFGNKKIVMLWSGSDVLAAREQLVAGEVDPWIANQVHWAVSPTLTDEVRALGLRCQPVHASFVEIVSKPKPLPGKFSVLLYVPSRESADLYGWDLVFSVARALPFVQFNVVGLKSGQTLDPLPNIKFHEWSNSLAPLIEETTVLWRPVRHDAGTSFMVLESLAHGRHVLYTYSHPGCIRVTDALKARVEIEKFLALHEARRLTLNYDGIDYVARYCSRDRVRAEILQRWEEIIVAPRAVPDPASAAQAAGSELRDSARVPRKAS
jgi:hypothetical protein